MKGEGGGALILALAVIGLLGVLAASLLTVAFTSFKTTQVVRGSDARLYGADGGADIGVELVRSNSSYCPSVSASPQSLPTQTINGRSVQVTCQTVSLTGGGGSGGGGVGVGSHSLVITGYPSPNGSVPSLAGAVTANSSQKGDLHFVGPAFNAGGFGFSGNGAKLIFDNTLDQYDSPTPYCTNAKNAAAGSGNPTVSGAWTCRQPGSYAVPDPLPTLKVPTATAPGRVTSNGCTTMFPGKYTSAPSFSSTGKYYLASGVYYFENAGTITLNGQVFGGKPGATETQKFTGITPCSNDTAANVLVPGSATGSGVVLVLGGNSQISIANSTTAKIELYARVPGNAALEGTAGVSIYAPRTAGTGYLAWNATTAFNQSQSKPQVVVHGLVYVPNSPIDVLMVTNANAGNAAIFSGGLVTQKLTIRTTGSQKFSSASFATVPGNTSAPATVRTIVVTATASEAGSQSATVRVVMQLDAASPLAAPTILSWRKV